MQIYPETYLSGVLFAVSVIGFIVVVCRQHFKERRRNRDAKPAGMI
jgi:hypothetical protein